MVQTVADIDLHRVVGACLIYNHARRFLILKRRPDLKVYPGLWTIPGGGMRKDDYAQLPQTSPDGWEAPLEIALRREIKEEANVEVGPLEYLSHFTFIRPDDVPVFGVRFAAPYVSGKVAIDPKDSTKHEWILALDVPAYNFLGNIADVICEFDEKLQERE
jgi:8-oxo-dGTP pyrophosphatase MutT (NUDIX family)